MLPYAKFLLFLQNEDKNCHILHFAGTFVPHSTILQTFFSVYRKRNSSSLFRSKYNNRHNDMLSRGGSQYINKCFRYC